MRGFFTLLVLLFAVYSVSAQSNAATFVSLTAPIAVSTSSTQNTQVNGALPPCSSIDYVTSTALTFYQNTTTTIQANIFLLDFDLTQATKSVTVQLLYKTPAGVTGPLTITSQATGFDNCVFSGSVLTASQNNNCGLNYYCDKEFRDLAGTTGVQLIVRVTSAADEAAAVITYTLELNQRLVPVQIITFGTPFPVLAALSPAGESPYTPTIGQQHYYVNLGPLNPADRVSVATYLIQTSCLTQTVFSLYGVNTTVATSWTITVNPYVLADNSDCGTPATGTLSTATDTLTYILSSCSTYYKNYFIAVDIPTSGSTKYNYTVSVAYTGAPNSNSLVTYVPTFQAIISQNNTIVPSMVGDGYYYNSHIAGDPYNVAYFFLNLQSTASGSWFQATLFGITRTDISATLSSGGAGDQYALHHCPGCNQVTVYDTCYSRRQYYARSGAPDFCKLEVKPCQYQPSSYYFVSVRGFSNFNRVYNQYYYGTNVDPSIGYDVAVQFSIMAQVFTFTPVSIASLPSTVDNGFTIFTDISSVQQATYNHYTYAIGALSPVNYYYAALYANNQQTPMVMFVNFDDGSGNAKPAGPILNQKFYGYYEYQNYYSPLYFVNSQTKCNSYSNVGYCTTSQSKNDLIHQGKTSTCQFDFYPCYLYQNNVKNILISVYGQLTPGHHDPSGISNYMGYNRSISYTLNFGVTTAPELLFDRITNVQHLYRYYNNFISILSHQFLFKVPRTTSQSVVSSIRFRLHDFYKGCDTNEDLYAYLQCNNPTGPCDCYISQQSCGITDSSIQYCDLTSNLCDCPTGTFYVSVALLNQETPRAYCKRPFTYQITPFLTTTPISDTLYTSDLGVGNIVTYVDTFYQIIPFQLDGYAHKYLAYYYFPYYYSMSNQVYQIVNNVESATDSLVVRVKYANLQIFNPSTFIPVSITRAVVAFDAGCLVDFCTGYAVDQVPESSYFQPPFTGNPSNAPGPLARYCDVTILPCYFTQDIYYVRLFAWTTANDFHEYAGNSALLQQTIDYTLEFVVNDWTPVPLTLNVPLHNVLETERYAHYSLDLTTVPDRSSWVRFSAYLNQESRTLVNFFINYGSLAGRPFACYDYVATCRFGTAYVGQGTFPTFHQAAQQYQNYSPTQYCDFFLEPCVIPPTGTIFTSLFPIENFGVQKSIEYTYVVETQSVIQLSTSVGYPITGLLLFLQSSFYSFTLNPTNYNPFYIQVQSIEPYPAATPVLQSLLSSSIPGSFSAAGTCNCNGVFSYNAFTNVIYNCGNIGTQPYYLTVRSVYESFYTPVSYTVRGYYAPRQTGTISIQQNILWQNAVYTPVPQPLNYGDIIDYTISASQLSNSVLYIGISDLSYSNTTAKTDYRALRAFLNLGFPASPQCFYYNSGYIVNTIQPTPNGQLMYAFQIPPCAACTGTYYLSIFAGLDEPQPISQARLNFTLAVWTTQIAVPASFPTSFPAGQTTSYTFNNANALILCESRFGQSFNIDYYFITSTVATAVYQQLQISYSNTGSISGTSFDLGTSSSDLRFINCGSCLLSSSGQPCNFGCTTATSTAYFGTFGYTSCPSTNNNQAVQGPILSFLINNNQPFTANSAVSVGLGASQQFNLNARTFTQATVSLTGLDPTTWSSVQITASFSSGSNTGFCFNFGSTGITFPPSSYCPQACAPFTTQTFSPCCIDPTDTFTITAYNQDQSNQATATVSNTLTASAFSGLATFSVSNTTVPSTPVSFATPTTTQYKFVQFALTSAIWSSDSVLDFQVTATGGGSRTVYLSYGGYLAGDSFGGCIDSAGFSCTTDCNFQLPACSSSPIANGIGVYYIGVISNQASTSPNTNVLLFAQSTTVYSGSTSTISTTGTVPVLSSGTNAYYTHRKFFITRTLGDAGFAYQNGRYQIALNTANTNSLQLYIFNPSQSSSFTNILAGDSNFAPPFSNCAYNSDIPSIWDCSPNSDGTTNAGSVNCVVDLCNAATPDSYLFQTNTPIYVSVRNTNVNNQAVQFTITNSFVYDTQPSDVQTISINPTTTAVDATFTQSLGACGATNAGGFCSYTTPTLIDTLYITIPIPANFGDLDYLIYNFTAITGATITVYSWSSSECEPSTNPILTCAPGSTTCWFATTSITRSLFSTNNGLGSTSIPFTPVNYYLKVTGIANPDSFNIQIRQITPVQVVQSLSRTQLSTTSQTYTSWTGRYIFFNIQTPTSFDYNLVVQASASCFATAPVLYYNLDNYQYAFPGSTEGTLTFGTTQLPASLTFSSCGAAVGGNNYFGISTGTSGNPTFVNPQITLISFTATLSFVNPVNIAWNCPQTLLPSTTYNYVLLADGENFGAQIALSLNCPGCTYRYILPYARNWLSNVGSQVAGAGGPIIYDTSLPVNNVYFNLPTENSCIDPCATPTSEGVICGTATSTQSLNNCQFTNGRYFITITTPASLPGGQATFIPLIYRTDYPLFNLGLTNPKQLISDVISPNRLFTVSSAASNRIQYYQINAPRATSQFIQVEITLVNTDITPYSISAVMQYGFSNLFGLPLRTSVVGTATSSCSSFTGVPSTISHRNETMKLFDGLCASSTLPAGGQLNYYIAVYANTNSVPTCRPIGYNVLVTNQIVNSTSIIASGVPVCDFVESPRFSVVYSGQYYRDYYYYPENNHYYQLTASQSALQFATLTVAAMKIGVEPSTPIDVFFGNYPTTCSSSASPLKCVIANVPQGTNINSQVPSFLASNSLSVLCGHGPQVWIVVHTGATYGYANYQLQATVNQRPVTAATSATTTVTASSAYSITNTGVITSVTTTGGANLVRVVKSDTPQDTSCSSAFPGCPSAYGSCSWLSEITTYYALVDFNPTISLDSCGNNIAVTQTLVVNTIAPVVLSETTTYSTVSGQTAIFTRALTAAEQATTTQVRVRVQNLNEGTLTVSVGCNGAVSSTDTATCSYFLDSFIATTTNTDSYLGNFKTIGCSCTVLYITVLAGTTCGSHIQTPNYQLSVDLTADSTLSATGVALAAGNTWVASQSLQRWSFAPSAQYNYWTVQSTADGFLHVGLGNVNNTAKSGVDAGDTVGHQLTLNVYLRQCLVASCTTGLVADVVTGLSRTNVYDRSCFINILTATSGLSYTAEVTLPNGVAIPYGTGAFYRIQAFNTFTDISTTQGSSVTYQIQGRARQYFKTPATANSLPASVVIKVNVLNGPRLIIQVADSPNFIDNQNRGVDYTGYVQSKVCPFGTCTIEIPTLAAHPGPSVSTLYIWVSTVPNNDDQDTTDPNDYRLNYEKPTFYQISSTVGTANCGPIASILPANSFCQNLTTGASTSYWKYRDPTTRVLSANCDYTNLLDRCPTPTYECRTFLNRFSCLNQFRECDAQGFQVQLCGGVCQSAINVCGPWYSQYVTCKENNLRYICQSARYAAAEPCTGDVTVVNSPGGYDFGIPGSTDQSTLPYGNQNGGFNYQTSILPSPTPATLTPDQVEPTIPQSPSQDCASPTPSTTPSPGSLPSFIPNPSFSFIPPSPTAASQHSLSVVLICMLVILSLWIAF